MVLQTLRQEDLVVDVELLEATMAAPEAQVSGAPLPGPELISGPLLIGLSPKEPKEPKEPRRR